MDATLADELLVEAEEARAAMRRGGRDGTERIEHRYEEIRAALDWYLAEGSADRAFRLSAALVPFWMATGRADEGMAWFERALRRASAGVEDGARARALHDHGYLAFFAGRYDLADRRFAESRALAERAGDRDVLALALAGAARVALDDDPRRAVELLRGAMDATEELPDGFGRSSAEHVLGVALQLAGDLPAARDVISARLERARKHGNDYVAFVESANLSMVERKLGALDRAAELSREALRLVVAMDDRMAIPWVVNGLAAVNAERGRHDRAATLLGIAEGLLAAAGGAWPADEREQYEGTLASVADALAPDVLEEARTRGRGMDPDGAVAFALADEEPVEGA